MKPDEAIEEIGSIRRQIAKECENDPHKLVQHYIQRQQQNAQRIRKNTKRSSSRTEA